MWTDHLLYVRSRALRDLSADQFKDCLVGRALEPEAGPGNLVGLKQRSRGVDNGPIKTKTTTIFSLHRSN